MQFCVSMCVNIFVLIVTNCASAVRMRVWMLVRARARMRAPTRVRRWVRARALESHFVLLKPVCWWSHWTRVYRLRARIGLERTQTHWLVVRLWGQPGTQIPDTLVCVCVHPLTNEEGAAIHPPLPLTSATATIAITAQPHFVPIVFPYLNKGIDHRKSFQLTRKKGKE